MKQPLPIRLVWARDLRGAIGKDGGLPWFLPADLAHFQRETKHSICIMGRKTFQSLPKREENESPLPGRPLIIMSKDPTFLPPERVGLSRTITDALGRASMIASHFPKHLKTIDILGGAQIYDLWWPIALEVVETVVHTEVEGADTRIPAGLCPTESSGWEIVKTHRHERDTKHRYTMDFIWWRRTNDTR